MNGGIKALFAGTQKGLGSLKVVMATGLYKTAAGVVGQKIFKDSSAALRTYLTIHLRSSKAAQAALSGIEDMIQPCSKEEPERLASTRPSPAARRPALNPYRPTQSMAAPVIVIPGRCGGLSSLGKPRRLPSILARTSADTPAVTCTTSPPAKSMTPNPASQPPPQIQ